MLTGRRYKQANAESGNTRGRLGNLVVRASDLRGLNGCTFDPRPPHYRSVGTGVDDSLRAGIPSWYVTSHPGRLSLLPSVGREMSTGQSAAMRSG